VNILCTAAAFTTENGICFFLIIIINIHNFSFRSVGALKINKKSVASKLQSQSSSVLCLDIDGIA